MEGDKAVPLRVDAETAIILREAYHKIEALFRADHYGLYDYVRVVAGKIAPFRGIIEARLDEFPKLTATRLWAEIRAAGYAGCYTQVKEYVPSEVIKSISVP